MHSENQPSQSAQAGTATVPNMATSMSNTPQSGRKRPAVSTRDKDEIIAVSRVPVDQDVGPASLLTPEPTAKRRLRCSGAGAGRSPNREQDGPGSDRGSEVGVGCEEENGREDNGHEATSVFTPGTNTAHLLLHLRRKWVAGGAASQAVSKKTFYSSPPPTVDGLRQLASESPTAANVTDDNDTPTGPGDKTAVRGASPSSVMASLFIQDPQPSKTAVTEIPSLATSGTRSRATAQGKTSSTFSASTSRRCSNSDGHRSPSGRGAVIEKAKVEVTAWPGAGSSAGGAATGGIVSAGTGMGPSLKHRIAARHTANRRSGAVLSPRRGNINNKNQEERAPSGGGRDLIGCQKLTVTNTLAAMDHLVKQHQSANASVQPMATQSGASGPEGCSCKKSLCLKLYCQCFAGQMLCSQSCKCENCYNNASHGVERQIAVRELLCRSPHAFDAKFCKTQQVNAAGGGSATSAVVVHNTGCGCSKSACLKRYCECFNGGIACSDKCRCKDCKNTPEAVTFRGIRGRSSTATTAVTATPSQPSRAGQCGGRGRRGAEDLAGGGRGGIGEGSWMNMSHEMLMKGPGVATQAAAGNRERSVLGPRPSGTSDRAPLEILPGFSASGDGPNRGTRV